VEAKTGVRISRSYKDQSLRQRIKESDYINSTAHINSGSNNGSDPENVAKTRALSEHCGEIEPEIEPEDINKSSLIEAFNKSSPNKSVRNSACAHDLSFFQKDGNLPETRIHTKSTEAVLEVKEVRYKLKGSMKIFSQEEANRLFAGNNALEFERL
jgi:hypothetical protein